MQRYLLITLGWISLGLGLIGSVLPVLPTTPFILLAAYLFSKSSDKLYLWLIQIPKFGKVISDWNENGIVSNKSKMACAITLLTVVIYIAYFTVLPLFIKITIGTTLFFVGLFVLSRPSAKTEILVLSKGELIEKS